MFFLLFPKLRLVQTSFNTVQGINELRKKVKQTRSLKMRFSVKLAIGCGIAFVFIVAVGFIAFPKMIKGKVKGVSGSFSFEICVPILF